MLLHPVSDRMIAECLRRLIRAGWLAFVTSSLSPSGRLRERPFGILDLVALHAQQKQALAITVMRAGANADRRWNLWPDVLTSPWVRAWLYQGPGHAFEVWTSAAGARKGTFEIARSPVYPASLDFRLDGPAWHRGRRQTVGALTAEDD